MERNRGKHCKNDRQPANGAQRSPSGARIAYSSSAADPAPAPDDAAQESPPRACPACASDRILAELDVPWEAVLRANRHMYRQDKALELLQAAGMPKLGVCADCGFVYVPRPLEDAWLRFLYEEVIDWRKSLNKQQTSDKIQKRRSLRNRILAMAPSKAASILDVGCGWGRLLEELKECGHPVYGVELSRKRRIHAESLGARVFETLTECSAHGPFDIVLAVQFLEHDPDFASTLQHLHALLKPGGMIYVSAPCADHLFHYSEEGPPSLKSLVSPEINPWEHVNYFRASDLIRILRRNGFDTQHPKTLEPVSVLQDTCCIGKIMNFKT